MKTKILSNLSIIICFFVLFYSFHFYSYNRCLCFIKEWNGNTIAPYCIDFESIQVERKIFSSPFKATISILKMKLIFKNNETIIASNGKTTINFNLFDEQNQSTVAQLTNELTTP